MALVDTHRVWLTEDAYNRTKVELANLLVERFGYSIENGDPEAGEPRAATWTMVPPWRTGNTVNSESANSRNSSGAPPSSSRPTTASPNPAWS